MKGNKHFKSPEAGQNVTLIKREMMIHTPHRKPLYTSEVEKVSLLSSII
jgi:hypothetical protein